METLMSDNDQKPPSTTPLQFNVKTPKAPELVELPVEEALARPVEETVEEAVEEETVVEDLPSEIDETATEILDVVETASPEEADIGEADEADETLGVEAVVDAVFDQFIDDPETSSVEEMEKARERLDAQIKARVDAQKLSVITQVKSVMDTYGVTLEELVEALGGLKARRKGVKAKQKYRDPATGVTWSGRGKEPAWIKDKDRELFLIAEPEA
jgi:DNA-binding protein H-NS